MPNIILPQRHNQNGDRCEGCNLHRGSESVESWWRKFFVGSNKYLMDDHGDVERRRDGEVSGDEDGMEDDCVRLALEI